MNNMADNRSQSLVHWGLTRWPFRGTPAVDELYPTAGLTEALARIDYLVDGRRRVGLLTGESGVGKSLTLNAAALQLERHGRSVALVDATAVSAREFTWLVACGLEASPGEDADNLAKDDGDALVIDPDLAALVGGGGIAMVGREVLAAAEIHFRDPSRNRRPIDVHVDRRQEDADLPPLSRRCGGGLRGTRDQHPAVCRRENQVGIRRRLPLGVAKEIEEERGQ